MRWRQIDYFKSLWSSLLQYDSNVRECAETNHNSNGVLLWISNITLSARLGRKMGENEKLWITQNYLTSATAMSQRSLRFVFLKAFIWLVHKTFVEKRAKKVCDTWLGWRHCNWHFLNRSLEQIRVSISSERKVIKEYDCVLRLWLRKSEPV